MSEDLYLLAPGLSRKLKGGLLVVGEKHHLITRVSWDKEKKDLTIWAEGMEHVILDGGLWRIRKIKAKKYLLIKLTTTGPTFKYDPSWITGRMERK